MTPGQIKLKAWRENVPLFAREAFGVSLDKWQEDALTAFGRQDQNKLRLCLRACVGPGKSMVLAICGWNFLLCYGEKGNHPKGAAVSVTSDNLKDNLWPEFAKWQGVNRQTSFPVLANAFTWTKERIFSNDHPETWFLSARSYSKTADTEEQGRTLSGLHSKYVLALMDESGEIPVPVAKAAEQAMSETNCQFARIVQAGNPTSHDGILYAAATNLAHLWHVIRITGDPDDPNRSPRIDIEWAREQIKTYGRDNPWVMSSILGEFPESSMNTLLSPDDVEKAMTRHQKTDAYDFSQKRLGVDVARFGDDTTVLFPRQGLMAFKPVIMRNARTHDIAARIMQAKAKWGSEMEFIDDTGGFGAGVIDSLLQAGQSPMGVHFSESPNDRRYLNKRAEMWFLMSEWVKRGGCLPRDAQLARELSTPLYFVQNGRMQLEGKDQIKKRLGFSPDRGDALALTFAMADMPRANSLESLVFQNKNKMLSDYDPFKGDEEAQ